MLAGVSIAGYGLRGRSVAGKSIAASVAGGSERTAHLSLRVVDKSAILLRGRVEGRGSRRWGEAYSFAHNVYLPLLRKDEHNSHLLRLILSPNCFQAWWNFIDPALIPFKPPIAFKPLLSSSMP